MKGRNNGGSARAIGAVVVAAMSSHVPMSALVIETQHNTPPQYDNWATSRACKQYVPPKVNDGSVHIFQPRQDVSQHNGGPYTVQNNNGYHGPRAWQRPSQKYGRPDVRLFRQELGALPELMHSEDPLDAVDRELAKEAASLPRTMIEVVIQAGGLEAQLLRSPWGDDEEGEFTPVPLEFCEFTSGHDLGEEE